MSTIAVHLPALDPRAGPGTTPGLPVPLRALAVEARRAGGLGDVGQGDRAATPPTRVWFGQPVPGKDPECGRRYGQPGCPGDLGTTYLVRGKDLVHRLGGAASTRATVRLLRAESRDRFLTPGLDHGPPETIAGDRSGEPPRRGTAAGGPVAVRVVDRGSRAT